MVRKSTGITWVFGSLLAVTVAGIVYHWLSGFDYPASPAFTYELNVLGDLYEAFFLTPIGIMGLWWLHRGKAWAALLIAGVAANLFYNYAMIVTGRQNPWVLLWTVKLALAGVAICLVWGWLPTGPGRGRTPRAGTLLSAYLAICLVLMGGLMVRRLYASATGVALNMAMQETGPLDWGEPFLRDPVIFLGFATPVIVTAILGLGRGAEWGAKAAALAAVFIVSIVTIALFTGPFKELLEKGAITAQMGVMSVVMAVVAAPAIWGAVWLAQRSRGAGASR